MPLGQHQQSSTMREYCAPVTSLLAMLFRSHPTYKTPMPDGLKSSCERLMAYLVAEEADNAAEALHKVLQQLWFTRHSEQGPAVQCDPTIQYVAMVSINESLGFKEPKHITSVIAKLERAIRLTVVQEIHNIVQQEHVSQDEACDRLSCWFTEKTQSTFNSLRSLQHRASAIAFDTIALPKVWWTDRDHYLTMLYEGNILKFSDICGMFHKIEKDAVHMWEHDILLGMPLQVPSSGLVDNLSNSAVGYSFIEDGRNPHLQDKHAFLKAVLNSPEVKAGFFIEQSGQMI